MPASAPAPVLTGVPVSGMAYLDRPAPAGYFIFPDLSVRHEGRYRLRFGLYEHSNDETSQQPVDPLEPREFCTHRLDVKSKPFTVFSAKKFPGLAESTTLSRIVAEQGCRVRIRRDVRMRRRNDRVRGRESVEAMDETQMMRAQRAGSPPDQYDIEAQIKQQTPQVPATPPYQQPPQAYGMHRSDSVDNRKRSGSDVSVASTMEGSMRYNGGYMPPAQNHGSYGHPAPPAQAPTTPNHLAFGGNAHSVQPPAPPAPTYNQQAHSQDVYGRNSYMPDNRAQYQVPPSAYQSPAPHAPQQRRDSVDEYRQRRESDASFHGVPQYRPSTPSMVQPQYNGQMQQTGYSQPQYAPSAHQSYQPQQQPQPPQPQALPPIRLPLPPLEPRVWNSQPTTPSATVPPQNSYPQSNPSPAPRPQQRPAPSINPPQIPAPNPSQFSVYYPNTSSTPRESYGSSPAPQPADSGKKRQWGSVFNPAHTEGSMRGGMRPNTDSDVYGSDATTPFVPAGTEVDDDYDDIKKLKMTYRRADGVEIVRKLQGEQ
jgi:hypothetical protein